MRRMATVAEYGLLALFTAGIVVQVFLAGLGTFGREGFGTHADVGGIVHGVGALVLLAAALGPRTRAQVLGAIALVVVNTVQIGIVEADAPGIAALHPTLALVVLAIAIWMLARLRPVVWDSGAAGSGAAPGR